MTRRGRIATADGITIKVWPATGLNTSLGAGTRTDTTVDQSERVILVLMAHVNQLHILIVSPAVPGGLREPVYSTVGSHRTTPSVFQTWISAAQIHEH